MPTYNAPSISFDGSTPPLRGIAGRSAQSVAAALLQIAGKTLFALGVPLFLAPSEYGVYAYYLWMAGVAIQCATSGLTHSAQKFIPGAGPRTRQSVRRLLVRVGLSAACVSMIWVAMFALRTPTTSAPAYRVVPVLLIVIALGAYNLICAAILRGELEFAAVTTAEGLTQAARLFILTLLAISRTWATVFGLILAELTGALAQAGWLTYRIRRSPQRLQSDSHCAPRAQSVLRYAAAVWVIAVIDIAIWQRIEIAFLQHYSSSSAAGIFNLVMQITQACILIPTVAISALFPTFAELDSRDVSSVNRAYNDIATLVWSGVLPLYALGLLFTPILLSKYGPQYAVGYSLIPYVMFSRTVSLLGALSSTLLYAIGKQRAILKIVVVGATLNVLGNFVLVPRFGLMGAAISVCCFQPLVSIMTLCVAHRVTGGSGNLRARTLVASAVGIIACAYIARTHIQWWLLPVLVAAYGLVLYSDQGFREFARRMCRAAKKLTNGQNILGFLKPGTLAK